MASKFDGAGCGASLPADRRPEPQNIASSEDLYNWYWTRAELAIVARHVGVSTSGTKEDLLARIAATFRGENTSSSASVTPNERKHSPLPQRRRLTPPFDAQTVIPTGHPITREIREWLTEQLGHPVRVSQSMRDFMREPQGGRLQDLLDLAERPPTRRSIPTQFELNRFMRVIARDHPEMTRSERLAAWNEFRHRPSQERALFLDGDVLGHPSSDVSHTPDAN